MGGVPSETRFQNINQSQWSLLLTHYYDKKQREKEEIVQGIEYLAMLVSINPKGVSKVIAGRKKQKKLAENQGKEEFLKVNENGENEMGQFVNTTFFADLEKYGGKEVLEKMDNPQDYKIEVKEDESFDDDEDDKFLREAKKLMAEREKEIEEEDKFKKEHPELFGMDEIVFE